MATADDLGRAEDSSDATIHGKIEGKREGGGREGGRGGRGGRGSGEGGDEREGGLNMKDRMQCHY